MTTEWSPSTAGVAEYLGVIELESGEHFDILRGVDRLIFGGACNVGFLESGYIVREDGETDDELLAELVADLLVFYSDGPRSVSRIVVNDRM